MLAVANLNAMGERFTDAENEKVRVEVEACYELPTPDAAAKASVAALALAYDGEGLDLAVARALRSIAGNLPRRVRRPREKTVRSDFLD